MAVLSIKNKLISRSMLVGNSPYIPPGYESIASITVSNSTTSSVNFTSIPSTYSHLELRAIARDSSGSGHAVKIRFNSDTGSNYSYMFNGGGGTSQSTSGTGTATTAYLVNPTRAGDFPTNNFSPIICRIDDYANTNKYKTFSSIGGRVNGNSSYMDYVEIYGGNWRSTNAITAINLFADDNWVIGTSFALYGIK